MADAPLDLDALKRNLQNQLDRIRRLPTEPLVSVRPDDLRALIDAVRAARELAGLKAMVEARGEETAAVIEKLVAERDALKAERDDWMKRSDWNASVYDSKANEASALHTERDAYRTALEGAAEELEQVAAYAGDILDTWPDNAQIVTSCGHFRRVVEVLSDIRKALTP